MGQKDGGKTRLSASILTWWPIVGIYYGTEVFIIIETLNILFGRNCNFSGVLDDMEFGCYTQWFDHLVKKEPPQLDLIGEQGEGRGGAPLRKHR